MVGTKRKLMDAYYEISSEIDHGECFYDPKMFQYFLKNLDELKELAQKLFDENQASK
jgi:response regulator RpfG family c-di-GMP phosphodiesterase